MLSRAAADIYAIYALWQKFAAELEENGQHKLYYDIELPLVEVLADMQYTGVAVDRGALEEFGKRLSGGIAELCAARLLEEGYGGIYKIHAVENRFVPTATVTGAIKACGLDTESMIAAVSEK